LLFGKKGCERGWGRNAGKGLVLYGLIGFWGLNWPMLGEVGSLFVRGIIFYMRFRGYIPQE